MAAKELCDKEVAAKQAEVMRCQEESKRIQALLEELQAKVSLRDGDEGFTVPKGTALAGRLPLHSLPPCC